MEVLWEGWSRRTGGAGYQGSQYAAFLLPGHRTDVNSGQLQSQHPSCWMIAGSCPCLATTFWVRKNRQSQSNWWPKAGLVAYIYSCLGCVLVANVGIDLMWCCHGTIALVGGIALLAIVYGECAKNSICNVYGADLAAIHVARVCSACQRSRGWLSLTWAVWSMWKKTRSVN
jgi:hypothetical protein